MNPVVAIFALREPIFFSRFYPRERLCLFLGATRSDVAETLARELAASEPQMFTSLSKRIPDMLPKSYRWVAEMREINSFLADDPNGAELYRAAARVYEKLAINFAEDGAEVDMLRRFFIMQNDSS